MMLPPPSLGANVRRRKFLAAVTGSAVLWPLTSAAQTIPKRPAIGLLTPSTKEIGREFFESFFQGMRELGYLERRDYGVEERFAEGDFRHLQSVAEELVRLRPDVIVAGASVGSREIDAVFAGFVYDKPDALFVSPEPFFFGRRMQLAHLALRHGLPAMYTLRAYAAAGGLMSYGTNISDAYHQAGVYAGRILKGAAPGDLPVVQSSKFELVINAQTARILGLEIPPTLLARADEVIE